MKRRALVKLDIFSKIGLGHFSRINNLVEADSKTDYFLAYKTDIKVKLLLEKSKFKKCFNIGSNEEILTWNDLNQKNKISIDSFKTDISITVDVIKDIENNFGFLSFMVLDNYLVNKDWFDLFSDYLTKKNINLIYLDDFNIGFEGVNLSIFYPTDKNFFKKKTNNNYIASGLKYCPFSLDLINKRKEIETKINYCENKNIILSFGFFDQLNMSIDAIQIILAKTNYNIILFLSKDAPGFNKINLNYGSNIRVKIISYVSKISEIYASSATSIGTFGLMSLEKAFLGIPQFNIIEELNQKNTEQILTKYELAISFKKLNEIFDNDKEVYLIPNHFLVKKLFKSSSELFGNGVLEWVKLIDYILNK